MPSADQVPVKNTHSITMRWHMWVVLIAGSTGSALRAVRPPNPRITPVVRRDLVYRASAMGSDLITMRWHMWVVLIAGSTGSALRAVRPPNPRITPVVRRDLVYRASAMGSL